jgi:hypothetical protein
VIIMMHGVLYRFLRHTRVRKSRQKKNKAAQGEEKGEGGLNADDRELDESDGGNRREYRSRDHRDQVRVGINCGTKPKRNINVRARARIAERYQLPNTHEIEHELLVCSDRAHNYSDLPTLSGLVPDSLS